MHIVRFPDSRPMKDEGVRAFRDAGLPSILTSQRLIEEGTRGYTVEGLTRDEIEALERTGLTVEVYEGLKLI